MFNCIIEICKNVGNLNANLSSCFFESKKEAAQGFIVPRKQNLFWDIESKFAARFSSMGITFVNDNLFLIISCVKLIEPLQNGDLLNNLNDWFLFQDVPGTLGCLRHWIFVKKTDEWLTKKRTN